jgi:cation transport regulator ChaC
VAPERWIFGYGSLVWRPAFEHRERVPGSIRGFARRFWQGSPDHRGVPHAPGRVVTLVPEPDAICWGMGYRVSPEVHEGVLAALDERESGGFERRHVELCFPDASRAPATALVYVAPEGNPNFLGPAPIEEMAAQVLTARGRSGANSEYVLRLADALRELGVEDDHVFELAAGVASGGAFFR